MRKPRSRTKPHAETIQLRDLILADAAARDVPLEQYALRVEVGLPVLHLRLGNRVLRGCSVRLPGRPRSWEPDVVTVHGSGHRATKMWPRKRDGTFDITAIVDHLLALIEVEMSRSKPNLVIPSGVSPSVSGLHVVHLAAIQLGALGVDSKAEALFERVADTKVRARIEAHLGGDGLTDRDMRAVGDAAGLFLSTPNKMDFDPFEPINDRILTVLQIGKAGRSAVVRRYVLILDRQDAKIELADPAGDGLTVVATKKLANAWKLAARRGRSWMGTVSVARQRNDEQEPRTYEG